MATRSKKRARREKSAPIAPSPAPAPASSPSPGSSSLVALTRLVHPFPSLLVAALTVVLLRFAEPDASRSLYLQLGLGMLCYQFAIGVVNDIADRELDAASKPWKAIPSGLISRRAAEIIALGFIVAGMAITFSLDFGVWLIGLAGLACGLAYDVAFKRTALSFVPWALAFPLIPVWVYAAAGEWDAILWWTFPLGGLFGAALHFANQSPGATDERRMGVQGVAQRLGSRRSARLSLALFGLASSVAALVLVFVEPTRAVFLAAVATIGLFLAPRTTMFFGRDGLFGLLAASSAMIAALFLSAV